jgi:hypothetical protein
VRYVFDHDDGWIVLFDHGEFGGGIEWYARAGGPPRSIVIGGQSSGNSESQNVNRALAVGGELHMTYSGGQLAKLWREHDHFTSQVVARYASEPFDWIREPDGSWLVATHRALVRTTEAGTSTLVARFPDLLSDPDVVIRAPDGTFYVGARNGVLRLTPTWPEIPRYAQDWLEPVHGPCKPGPDE